MLVALAARDNPAAMEIRISLRAAHRHYLVESGVVQQAGPLLNERHEMCGSLIIIDVPDMAAAREFADNDPYAQKGLFDDVTLLEWNRLIG